jgi:hypothetical protein
MARLMRGLNQTRKAAALAGQSNFKLHGITGSAFIDICNPYFWENPEVFQCGSISDYSITVGRFPLLLLAFPYLCQSR